MLGLILCATVPSQVCEFSSSMLGEVDKDRRKRREVELERNGEPESREGILRHRKGIFRVKVGEEVRVS